MSQTRVDINLFRDRHKEASATVPASDGCRPNVSVYFTIEDPGSNPYSVV